MSPENHSPNQESLRIRIRNKLGSVIGLRPTWFNEEAWDSSSPGERRLIRVMHDKGGKGFRILPSRETTMKNYKRDLTRNLD